MQDDTQTSETLMQQVKQHPVRYLLIAALTGTVSFVGLTKVAESLDTMGYPAPVRQAWAQALAAHGNPIHAEFYNAQGDRLVGSIPQIIAQQPHGALYVRFTAPRSGQTLCTTEIPVKALESVGREFEGQEFPGAPSNESWSRVCKLTPEEIEQAQQNITRWQYLDRAPRARPWEQLPREGAESMRISFRQQIKAEPEVGSGRKL